MNPSLNRGRDSTFGRFGQLVLLILLAFALAANARPQGASTPSAPPKVFLLVHQEFQPGAAQQREALEKSLCVTVRRLHPPITWIETEAVTDDAGALYLDPFDSFESLDKAGVLLAELYGKNPELAPTQQKIDTLIAKSHTTIALRRDDLGYRASTIDLSKAPYFWIFVARIRPGHEAEFAEADRLTAAASEASHGALPWVVYQVHSGMLAPSFITIIPMASLKEVDDALADGPEMAKARGPASLERLHQLSRNAYESYEANLYAITPSMSHVTPEFAAGDPAFCNPAPAGSESPKQPAPRRPAKTPPAPRE